MGARLDLNGKSNIFKPAKYDIFTQSLTFDEKEEFMDHGIEVKIIPLPEFLCEEDALQM